MDPSIILCEVHDSFSTKSLTLEEALPHPGLKPEMGQSMHLSAEVKAILPRAYHPPTPSPLLTGDIRVAPEREVPNLPPDSRICDPQRYNDLQKRKDRFANYPEKVYRDARNEANPSERIGKIHLPRSRSD